MKNSHASIAFSLLFIAALLAPFPTHSTTLAQLSLAQLASSATIIVRAQCLGASSDWRDGELWTVSLFRAEEVWKGDPPRNFQVWMIGGRSGPVVSYVPGAPRFRPGEDTILFLEPTLHGTLSITAWGEGTFRIHKDPRTGNLLATQDTSSIPTFDPVTRRFRAEGIRDLLLANLKARVFSALAAEVPAHRSEP